MFQDFCEHKGHGVDEDFVLKKVQDFVEKKVQDFVEEKNNQDFVEEKTFKILLKNQFSTCNTLCCT